VLRPGGALLLRTNGARRGHAELDDWRVYDRAGLRRVLEDAGLLDERVTQANLAGSLWALARGRAPHAPDSEHDGIPAPPGRAHAAALGALLGVEARVLRHRRIALPYGHTTFAVAVRP